MKSNLSPTNNPEILKKLEETKAKLQNDQDKNQNVHPASNTIPIEEKNEQSD